MTHRTRIAGRVVTSAWPACLAAGGGRRRRFTFFLAASLAATLATSFASSLGCGAERPARYVLERDLGPFFYRRYQRTLDVEFVIADNPAVGHTATYVRRGPGTLAFATAFVTVFEKPASLSAEVRELLESLSRYRLAVGEVAGGHTWTLTGTGAGDERWTIWVSGRHVVKLGAPRGEQVPSELASAYMNSYPSDLDEHGRAREGTASRGPSRRERDGAQEPERPLPRSLRPNAPH